MSPMMLQYLEVKKEYQDYILFYRLGDFYEMFFEDAEIASRELDLTLTGRNCGEDERAPMCGVPYHACDGYLSKLVEKGYKVAICEQMEDPAGNGIVRREVVRLVTPGTVTLGTALDETKNNYLAALFVEENKAAIAFCDIAQNTIYAVSLSALSRELLFRQAINEFARFSPSELICNLPEEECGEICEYIRRKESHVVNCGLADLFEDRKRYLLSQQFARSEAELGFPEKDVFLPRACSALIGYLLLTQKTALRSISEITIYDNNQFLAIDANSRRNLELCETMRHGEKRGSLLWVLDKTKTGAGARMLRRMIEQPLTNCRAIEKRQSAVREFFESQPLREEVRAALANVQDIERTLSRIIYSGGSAKDLYALAQTASRFPQIASLLEGCTGEELAELCHILKKDVLPESEALAELLFSAIKEDPPFSVREGGFIAKGFNAELDELNAIMTESQSYLAKIEAAEKELTGIKTLRIGYNRVFGYYFEVSKSQLDLVPERYIRKQTLTNGERYITSELKDLETRILGAKDRAVALEYELFVSLCDKVKDLSSLLQNAAEILARIDVYASLAEVARKNNYTCPEVNFGDQLILKDARHPVVEAIGGNFFVPNDCDMNSADKRMMIITGPNMAGKSTYMRQCAIIVIMAQMGSFVPAKEAVVGIVDKIFTRVGASDDLSTGQSTFMLEMSEVAYILQNATKKSLIVYDEIGRGTSTYDGMSIAKAVVEYTAGKKCGAKTLFATHYHELSVLENELEGVKNFNIAAKKRGDSVLFLRKIVPGPADDSYGIEVANLAGVPAEVIRRAKEILKELEADRPEKQTVHRHEEEELPIFEPVRDQLIDSLKSINVDTLTPIEALGKLYELSKQAKEI